MLSNRIKSTKLEDCKTFRIQKKWTKPLARKGEAGYEGDVAGTTNICYKSFDRFAKKGKFSRNPLVPFRLN